MIRRCELHIEELKECEPTKAGCIETAKEDTE